MGSGIGSFLCVTFSSLPVWNLLVKQAEEVGAGGMFWCTPGGQIGAAAGAVASEVERNLFAAGSSLYNPLVPLASCEQRYTLWDLA